MTCHLIIRVIAAIAVVIPASLAFALQPEPMGDIDQSFLLKAVEGQHAEVAFGQSAIQKASDDQVKQYGARMIQDHEKASQEGRQLAAKEGVRLPSQLSMEHQQSQQKLSQLSGKEFDKAYISLMVQEHMKDLGDFPARCADIKRSPGPAVGTGRSPDLDGAFRECQGNRSQDRCRDGPRLMSPSGPSRIGTRIQPTV